MTDYRLVPVELTEFSKGNTDPRGDCGMFVAGINHNPSSSPRDQWGHRIEVYGDTPEHAEELRDRVLRALAAPAVQGEPVAWLYEDELPDSYPYETMFPYSKVDGVRMFPVYAPQPAEQQPDVAQLVEALEASTHRLHEQADGEDDCRCIQCRFVRLRDAALAAHRKQEPSHDNQ